MAGDARAFSQMSFHSLSGSLVVVVTENATNRVQDLVWPGQLTVIVLLHRFHLRSYHLESAFYSLISTMSRYRLLADRAGHLPELFVEFVCVGYQFSLLLATFLSALKIPFAFDPSNRIF